MGGLWRKLWWRALCVLGLVFVITVLVPLLTIALYVQMQGRDVLDFAGGSVIHIGPLPLFLALPWLAVEFYNLRREVPVPVGSYTAFAVAFAVTLQMMVYVPLILWSRAGMMVPLVAFALASGAGLVAGWTYARLTRK